MWTEKFNRQYKEKIKKLTINFADIKKGETINEDSITILRPNHGIDARDFDKVIGKKINCDVVEHQKLEWKMFD